MKTAGRVPCSCRASASDGNANVCLTLSNCEVDSDCGSGGYCSPSFASCQQGYFCHTASDTCTDDGDCRSGEFCVFNMTAGHWLCGIGCASAP
jgi:hypothetical protein